MLNFPEYFSDPLRNFNALINAHQGSSLLKPDCVIKFQIIFGFQLFIGQEEKGGHGAILQHPGNRVILVLSDMLSTKIDVGALDFTGLIFYRPSK